MLDRITFLFEDFCLFLDRANSTIKNTWNYFKYSCKNGDSDWDSIFLFMLIKWKIDRMSQYAKKHGHNRRSLRQAKQLDYASLLLDIIINDRYVGRVQEEHEMKWGKWELDFNWDNGRIKKVYLDQPLEKYEEADKEYNQMITEAEIKQEKCKGRLFKHILKYSNGWWD